VLTRAAIRIAHECTLAARSSRRQPSLPSRLFSAENIKAVTPSLLAACTLACAFGHDTDRQPRTILPHAPDTVPAP